MSDLISRQDALDAVNDCGICIQKILDIPSAEPEERAAKVIDHKFRISVSLNVVGEPIIGHEMLCENCKKKVLAGDDYCSHCGSKLIWDEEE